VFQQDTIATVYYSPCATGWGSTFLGIPTVPETPPDEFSYENYGAVTLTGYSGSCGVLIIPATLYGFPVTAIEATNNYPIQSFAQGNTNLTSVTIPGSVTTIGPDAFESCPNLGSVTIEEGVTSIGDFAFALCNSVTNLSIPASLTNLAWFAFADCGVTGIIIPSGTTTLGPGEFNETALTSITIPDSVTSIANTAFGSCESLTNVSIPNSVTNIGSYAFNYCASLSTITIPASVTFIGDSAFYIGNLSSIFFKGNAPALGDSDVFSFNDNPTAYYLPGTAGWDTFSAKTHVPEIPVVLWNPQIQTSDGSFGVRTNHFGFNITGTTNIPIAVQACSDLANPVWTPVQTLTLTNGLFYFSDPVQAGSSGRFYRIGAP
jgi:hypothetical protein